MKLDLPATRRQCFYNCSMGYGALKPSLPYVVRLLYLLRGPISTMGLSDALIVKLVVSFQVQFGHSHFGQTSLRFSGRTLNEQIVACYVQIQNTTVRAHCTHCTH